MLRFFYRRFRRPLVLQSRPDPIGNLKLQPVDDAVGAEVVCCFLESRAKPSDICNPRIAGCKTVTVTALEMSAFVRVRQLHQWVDRIMAHCRLDGGSNGTSRARLNRQNRTPHSKHRNGLTMPSPRSFSRMLRRERRTSVPSQQGHFGAGILALITMDNL